jgi:hypothetical protein
VFCCWFQFPVEVVVLSLWLQLSVVPAVLYCINVCFHGKASFLVVFEFSIETTIFFSEISFLHIDTSVIISFLFRVQFSIDTSVFYWKHEYPVEISVFYWTSAFRWNFNFLMRHEFYANTLGFSWNFNFLLRYEFSTNILLSINTYFSFLLVLQGSVKISVSYWDMSFLLILQYSIGTSGSF